MRVLSVSVLFALARFIAAQTPTANAFDVPQGGFQVNAGEPLDLKWNPTDGDTVTLTLRSGNPGALEDGMVIQANIPNNGQYTWDVPSDIATGADYTVEISDDQEPSLTNFTPQINVMGGSASASSSSMSITSTSSSSSSSATSSSTDSSSSTTSSDSSSITSTSSSSSESETPSGTSSQQSTSIATVNPDQTGAAVVRRVEGTMAALVAVGLGIGYAL